MKVVYGLLLGLSMTLAGCGGPPDDVADDESYDAGGYEESDEGVFDPMVGTMDRARGVEDMGMSRKDEMDAALEDLDQ